MSVGRVLSPLLALAACVVPLGCGRRTGGATALEQGLEQLRAGDYRRAARRLESAARRQPESATAFCNLGMAYWRMGDNDRAMVALRMAADLEGTGTNGAPLECLGQLLLALKRPNEARQAFQRAREMAGDSPRLLTSLAVAEYQAGENQNAALLLRKALDADAGYAPALYNLGVLQRDRLKNRKEAFRSFQRYLAIETNDPHAVALRAEFARLGIAATSQGADRETSAAGGGRTGAGVRPAAGGSRPISLRAGPIPGATGRTEARGLAANGTRGQRTSARGAVAQTPDTLLAKAREAIRREALDEALELLKAAVRNNPRNPDALWELAVLYDRRLHSPEEAAKTYRKFKEAFPDDPRSRGIPPAARAGGARRP